GPDRFAASLRFADGVVGQQRCLGLHIVHICRVTDAGLAHGVLDRGGHLFAHRRATDLFGLQLLAHGESHAQPRLIGLGGLLFGQRGEHGGVRADDAVGAAGPHDGNLADLVHRAGALFFDDLTERAVGDNASVIVDTAVAFGLSDDGDDAVGLHDPVVDELCQFTGVG